MKILIFFLALSIFSVVCATDDNQTEETEETKAAKEREEIFTKIVKECAESVDLDIKIAKHLLIGDYTDKSPAAKCFVRCLFKKEGFINEDDEPQLEFIADTLENTVNMPRKRLDEILQICMKNRKSVEPCEAAFDLMVCYTLYKTNYHAKNVKNYEL